MGAKWVILWEPYAGARVDHMFDIICHHIESVAYRFERRSWGSSFTHLKPILHDESQAALRHLFAISLGEEPNKHYILRPVECRILEMDVREKLQMMTRKTPLIFLFEGIQYQLDSGILRVGRVIINNTGDLRGVFIEMDFFNYISIERTRNLMEDNFNMFNQVATERFWPGRFVQIERSYAVFGLPEDHYTSKHTVLQYYKVIFHLAEAFPGQYPGDYRRLRQDYAALAPLVMEFYNRCGLP